MLEQRRRDAAQRRIHFAQRLQPCQVIENGVEVSEGWLLRSFLDLLKRRVPLYDCGGFQQSLESGYIFRVELPQDLREHAPVNDGPDAIDHSVKGGEVR